VNLHQRRTEEERSLSLPKKKREVYLHQRRKEEE